MLMALAQLTDKMDTKYIIASEPAGSHYDAYANKLNHLRFLRKWQEKTLFPAVSQHPDHLEGLVWFGLVRFS